MNQSYKEVALARAELYRFLGGLYIMEIDKDTLKKLKETKFPTETGNADMDEAYKMISDYIAGMSDSDEDINDLAADYAKVFLAAGSATGLAAFPYESVYTSKKHEIGGRTQQEAAALYLSRGWEPSKNMYRTMDDHAGLELEYMAIMCEEMAKAYDTVNPDQICMSIRDQKAFMETHLHWITAFCMDVKKYADTAFYQGVAKLTSAFIEQEKALLALGGAVWVTE